MLNMKKYINNIDMKRQSILLIAMMMSIVASAQERIEQLFSSLDARGDKTLLSKNHYEDNIDNPTTFCRYEEIMMTKKPSANSKMSLSRHSLTRRRHINCIV